MSRGVPRDPCIKEHSPRVLRQFADAFDHRAIKMRQEATALDQKADRYRKRAEKLEKVDG